MAQRPFSDHRTNTLVMTMDQNQNAEKILNLTMEIIYLLTGENYTLVKKSGDHVTHSTSPWVPEGNCRTWCPIMEPPHVSLKHERNNEQKILELTNEIIHLLNGEVPVRCEDVAVYFSLEEWEYLERHKELYKEVKMKDHQPHSPLVDELDINTLEGFESPSSSPYFINEDGTVVKNNQYTSTDQSRSRSRTNVADYVSCNITGTPEDIHSCEECKECFTSYSDLLQHQTSHRQDRPSCSEDVKDFLLESGIVIRRRGPIREKQHRCSECNKLFTTMSNLRKHQRIHVGKKPFECSECGSRFLCNSFLRQHQRIHTNEKPFTCSQCGKCFSLKAYLVSHMRIHTRDKPHVCSECGKGFRIKANLVRHEKIHSTEKPFECPECGKCFKHNTDLSRHQRTHTGEKPYACTDCGKRFSQSSNLFAHRTIHRGVKPLACSICGKCFRQRTNLLAHEKTHSGERPFVCTECGKCFSRNSNLVNHQKIHAREKVLYIL